MIYLDNAATTYPKPQIVVEEMSKCIKSYCGNPGRSSHSLALKSAEAIYNARLELADFFGADPESVVFTYNATYALNIAIKSLIKPGFHVLISDIEHNAVFRPIYSLSQRGLCTFDIFDTSGNDEDIIKSIESKISSKTKMIVANFVSNIGSRKLPIKKIGNLCKKNDIIFILDGSQGAGHYHINLKKMNINALCLPGHKGLYGPQGTGVIIYNEIVPESYIEGGTGINSKDPKMPDFLPEIQEAGTLSTPAIVGLLEGLKWLKTLNIDKIRSHEEDLYNYFCTKMSNLEDFILYRANLYPGNTICFNSRFITSNYLASELNKRGICVRSGFHCSPLAHKVFNTRDDGAVRVSFGVFNTRNDVIDLINALKEINCNNKKTGIYD